MLAYNIASLQTFVERKVLNVDANFTEIDPFSPTDNKSS